MEKVHILLYYKFANVKNPKKFAKENLEMCKLLGLFGKVLIAKEGINGSVSGTKSQTDKYKKFIRKIPQFSDIVFKEEIGELHPFTKMVVRVRKEIIRLDQEIDISKRGKYVNPSEFLKIYENKEDVIILDARNDYESKVGRFKNAIIPKIKTFREFPKVAKMLRNKKDKKIIMYCTGGIRCEKASAYLVQKGFKDVSQLEGGIITFCQQYPNTIWKGKCFVFDKRLLSRVDAKNPPISNCKFCNIPCDLYQNCKNIECNYFMTICLECEKDRNCCCSDKCYNKYKEHLLKKTIINRFKKQKINSVIN